MIELLKPDSPVLCPNCQCACSLAIDEIIQLPPVAKLWLLCVACGTWYIATIDGTTISLDESDPIDIEFELFMEDE